MRSPSRILSPSRRLAAVTPFISLVLLLPLERAAGSAAEPGPEIGPPVDHASEAVESIIAPSGEEAKLELAREAIEASRAAGTLGATPLVAAPESASPESTTPEDLAAEKLQRLEEAQAAVILPSELTGYGIETPPLQEVGPSSLNETEQLKLEAFEGATLRGGSSDE